MNVADIRLEGYDTVDAAQSIAQIRDNLTRRRFLVVLRDGVFSGILTVADIIDNPHILVMDCLSEKTGIDSTDSLQKALTVMEDHGQHFLPVFHDGQFLGVAGYKTIASALNEECNQARLAYEQIFHSTNDAIFLHDPQTGSILQANERATELTGYSSEELLSLRPEDLSECGEGYDAKRKIIKACRGGQEIFDWRIKRKDGEIFWAEVALSCANIMKRQCVIAVVRDISAKKRLQEYQDKVAHLESLRLLASGIAHDFNNYMTTIICSLDLLATHVPSDQKCADFLAKANKGAEEAHKLTQRLLNFSKNGVALKAQTDLSTLIRENAQFVVRKQNIELEFDMPGDLGQFLLGKDDIARVINNLTLNAVQAIGHNPGHIRFIVRKITLSSADKPPLRPGEYLKISISDNGPGIPKERLDKIFMPYFTTKADGTGLGLAIVYSTINSHGGLVDVESKVGEGTCFHLYLPLTIDSCDETLPPPPRQL